MCCVLEGANQWKAAWCLSKATIKVKRAIISEMKVVEKLVIVNIDMKV